MLSVQRRVRGRLFVLCAVVVGVLAIAVPIASAATTSPDQQATAKAAALDAHVVSVQTKNLANAKKLGDAWSKSIAANCGATFKSLEKTASTKVSAALSAEIEANLLVRSTVYDAKAVLADLKKIAGLKWSAAVKVDAAGTYRGYSAISKLGVTNVCADARAIKAAPTVIPKATAAYEKKFIAVVNLPDYPKRLVADFGKHTDSKDKTAVSHLQSAYAAWIKSGGKVISSMLNTFSADLGG